MITCPSCGKRKQHCAKGYCRACYMRWWKSGFEGDAPPTQCKECRRAKNREWYRSRKNAA